MYQHILVPVDLNENGFGDKAVELAVWHAQRSGGIIHLLNVLPGIHMAMVSSYFPKDAARKMMQDTQMKLREFAATHIPEGVQHVETVSEGKPWSTIVDHARQIKADLIIMPSHQRTKVDKLMLGSVAAKVVENAPGQILVLKPPGS
ncbi:universal stress protein [Photobacterium sp. GJ3]|uniref:universal stress protein n=1 Tax=Photobacterium sp. GJ3 TaxID=2829502 RepID=UPI001B8C18DF|nr:universal stress protein [Photobacterium sp. GJ3]QUJ67780.1 universal stress protein [Photobacterium sp. GJ3]